MTVQVRGSFQRSVNLVRDFYGKQDLDGYIVTIKACELLDRMVDSLVARKGGRAWSITGSYGSGKSAFALFATHLLQNSATARAKLAIANPALAKKLEDAPTGVYCPVLVVGSRESLGVALLRGLVRGTSAFLATFARHPGQPSKKVKACRVALRQIAEDARSAAMQEPSDAIILDLYQQVAAAVRTATGGGLLLIVDELGKFLEYAALYPERSDLHLLQQLAERASFAGDSQEETGRLLVFTILHQAFDRYAGRLSAGQRDEWRKVQGRFEDVAFVEPVSETVRLLAHAVQVADPATLSGDDWAVIDRLLEAVALRPDIDRAHTRQHLYEALPLHPAVSLIVGPLFRRLAQDKRSLFSFLASGEPDSFLDVLAHRTSDPSHPDHSSDRALRLQYYRLDHLYDYLIGAVGAALFNERLGKLWAETEAALSRLKTPNELAIRCLKQISLLSFAGPLAGLPPTTKALYATADASSEDVEAVLETLKAARLVTHRPFKDEFHIWQGSDFDLHAVLRKAREQIPARKPLAALLADVMPPTPIVARRHSFRTGTTRVFEVQYASDEAWQSLLRESPLQADGRIIYVLSEHDGETEALIAAIQELAIDSLTLVAVPDGLAALREITRELACLEWVRVHASELSGDEVARREVDQQLSDLSGYVQQRLASLLIADAGKRNPCTWVYRGEVSRLQDERSLQDKLSQICDEVFSDAPEIWNELLNRHKPSSSAVKGQKLLLRAMLEHADAERLGIGKYPAEYGMYASILHATGMHRKTDDDPDRWHFAKPDSTEHSGCCAVWDAVTDALQAARGQRVSIRQLHSILRRPPYGVRNGLIPVFLFAVYKSAEDEIAVYENGTFVPSVDFQTIERFLKSPDNFELQRVAIRGARAEVLHSLAPLVGLPASVQEPLPFVLRILGRIHGLPPYVRRTATLSQFASNVRETLLRAVEPMTLLFEDLPEACGIKSFLVNDDPRHAEVEAFTENLQEALRELGGAYDSLLAEIQARIARVFHLHSSTSDACRHELADRARLLLPHATGTNLKAFLVRATDEILDTRSWYESLAALVARRPPVKWRDEDQAAFDTTLHSIARRFYTLEPIAFAIQQEMVESGTPATDTQALKRVRLSVTVQYEDEHEHVINIHPEDSGLIEHVYLHLRSALAEEDVTLETKIAALAQLSNDLLGQRTESCDSRE